MFTTTQLMVGGAVLALVIIAFVILIRKELQ